MHYQVERRFGEHGHVAHLTLHGGDLMSVPVGDVPVLGRAVIGAYGAVGVGEWLRVAPISANTRGVGIIAPLVRWSARPGASPLATFDS